MRNYQKNGVKHAKKTAKSNSAPMVTDFGTRKILSQNFSHLVTIDRTALTNLGNPTRVNVQLVQDKENKYIKLTPISEKEKGGEDNE